MKMASAAFAAFLMITGSALAESTFTVSHGKTPDPVYVDLGTPGDSVGDQRIWNFSGQSDDRQSVVMDWLMTTTRLADGKVELERRVALGIFTFGQDGADSLLIQGVGLYPPAGSTVKVDTSLERAVIGGTGKFSGASGSVVSIHLDDGTWKHEFRLR